MQNKLIVEYIASFLKRLLLPLFPLMAVMFCCQPPAFGQEGPTVAAQVAEIPVAAPLNPAFLQQMSAVRPLGLQSVTADGHGLGFLPSPIDRSYLAGQSIFPIRPLAALPLPSSFDLRALGKVTPVKDQSSCGDCWAFATYGSLESNLLTAETWNFSENNLKNTHGFDWGPCAGGNGDMSTAYLARWDGPVNESDDPYNPSPPYTSPAGLSEQKHVQEVLILPGRTGPLDNDNIKQALMDYGGVWTSYYASGSYKCPLGPCTTTYYYSGTNLSDHAVTIVGWNDNFPVSSFSPVPPGDGAFIIKNSWGTWWGNSGYFYISYYDSKLGHGENYVFNDAEPVTNYNRVYQYDPLGMTTSIWYGSGPSTTGWFANVFTATASEQVSAVSFYTASAGSSYEIYVYTNSSSGPTSGSLAATTASTISIPGYHTITLPSPVAITSGQKFSVVVNLTTPGYNYPIPVEYPFTGYSSNATATPGQSYVSSNGTSWADITSFYANTNVCLKAFATAGDTTPPTDGTLSATPGNGQALLSWSDFSDSGGSGLKSSNTYKIVRSTGGNPPVQCTSGTQIYLGSGTSTTDTGLTNGTTYYYRACAYDNAGNISSGATAAATLPVRITVTTSPTGLQFTVDGTLYTTSQTFVWTPGVGHTIALSSPQSGGAGTRYVFSSWSDGGAQSHTITPPTDLPYTAGFATQYQLITAVSPASGGTVGPDCTSGCWYNSGSSAGLLASPSDGYVFDGWTGDCFDTNPSTSVAMSAAKSCTANFLSCGVNPAQNQRTTKTYTSLGGAYGDTTPIVGTWGDDTIRLLATTFNEGVLDLSRNISVTLQGGYDCSYSPTRIPDTVIEGSLTISGGTVTFDAIVIR